MKVTIGKTKVQLVIGDITEIKTDAIVNAANSLLAHGGGVAGAIVQKGGLVIQEESDEWVRSKGGALPVGSVAITTGGNLPAGYVIHAVGPRQGEGNEDLKLRKATLNSLRIAEEYGCKSIAFPAISTGIFGCPVDFCAEVMLSAMMEYVLEKTKIKKVVFCLFGNNTFQIFEQTLLKLTVL